MAQTIKLRRSSTEGKVPTTAQLALGELAINTYDGRIFFEKNDGSATIEHILTTDSITTGSITLTGKVTTGTLTLSGLSAQNSEATALMINGSNVVGTRELGSNAFTSTTIGTTTNALTDGTGIADFSFDGSGAVSIATDDSAIVHDNLSGFVANEHIDHTSVSITAGTGLNGGGTIASTRTLNVDDDCKNTSLNSLTGSLVTKTGSETLTNKTLTAPDINAGTVDSITSLTVANDIDIGAHQLRAETFRSDISTGTAPFTVASTTTVANLSADMVDGVEAHTLLNNSLNSFTASNANTSLNAATSSYLTTVDISDDTNLAVSDTSEVNMILSGDTLSAELIGGVVSGSSQITNIANSQLAGSIANSKLANSSISIGGISFSLGDTDATPAFDLQDATGYATSNLSGTITNSQLAGSIANGKLSNSAITISGTSVSLGGSISDETLFGGTGVVSGSSQVVTAATVKGALNGNLGTLTLGDSNDTVSIPGNLSVEGTRTFIDSTTLQIGDNIIELNGSGTNDGGIYVRDAEASTTTTGSLIWNTGDDKWTAGPKGSEDDVVLATATQTLTNKTINGSQLVDDSVTNAKLDNSSVSFGGVSVALGASDSTPAFNLADATGYQTSNLSGTITNSQLAGSIANGKLANSAITIMGTSTSLGGSFTTSDVVSALANTAVSNESLNSATGSYLTAHPNISAGSNISQDNSNGTVIQDLTITLDSNGHVTTATAGTVNLDGRYYTETESDTLYTKKLGQGVVSGSAQIDGASITNKSVSFGGVSVNLGSSDSTPAFNLADATGYLTSNLSGTITNSQLAGSIANGKLSNSAITISGTSVSLGSSISDETLFGGTGVISGSVQVALGSLSAAGENLAMGGSQTALAHDDASVCDLLVAGGIGCANIHTGDDSVGSTFGGDLKVTGSLTIKGSSAQNSEATSLMINSNGVVGTRELGSNAFNSTSFLTEHPNISAASSVNNSNGTVIQDVTLDSNGHVTGLASANLDSRYYTETESDTLFTKKLGQGIISGAAQITSFGNLEIANPTVTGTLLSEDVIQFTGLSSTTETTAVMIDSSNELSKRTLGSNAFTSTTIPTNNNQLTNGAGYITSFDITTQTDSKYLRSNATDTASGVITFSNSTSSTSKTNGAVIVTGGVGISGALNVGGDVTAFASSDERFKNLITPIENPNEKIKLLSGNTFVWNDKHEIYKGKKDIGVIAQEVEKVLPEIVETREDGYKAVKYEKIVALLIESNKELIKRVEELESKIK